MKPIDISLFYTSNFLSLQPEQTKLKFFAEINNSSNYLLISWQCFWLFQWRLLSSVPIHIIKSFTKARNKVKSFNLNWADNTSSTDFSQQSILFLKSYVSLEIYPKNKKLGNKFGKKFQKNQMQILEEYLHSFNLHLNITLNQNLSSLKMIANGG